MNIFRKIISFLVLVISVVVLVGICISPDMKLVWNAFGQAFAPFNFGKIIDAMLLFLNVTQLPIILIMLSFIGLTMPKVRKPRN